MADYAAPSTKGGFRCHKEVRGEELKALLCAIVTPGLFKNALGYVPCHEFTICIFLMSEFLLYVWVELSIVTAKLRADRGRRAGLWVVLEFNVPKGSFGGAKNSRKNHL